MLFRELIVIFAGDIHHSLGRTQNY